jgi:hypothetical protein
MIQAIGNFIRRLIATIKTFFAKLFTKDDYELVKENPFKGAKSGIPCFNRYNFSGVKRLLSTAQKITAKMGTKPATAAKTLKKEAFSIWSKVNVDIKLKVSDFVSAAQQSVGNDPMEAAQQMGSKAAENTSPDFGKLLLYYFGMDSADGDAAYKKADTKVIKRVIDELTPILDNLDKEMAKSNEIVKACDTAFLQGKVLLLNGFGPLVKELATLTQNITIDGKSIPETLSTIYKELGGAGTVMEMTGENGIFVSKGMLSMYQTVIDLGRGVVNSAKALVVKKSDAKPAEGEANKK